MQDFEKLGAFYLGRTKETGDLLLYDSKDLVTHAVCVGMTGSGKTGLCIGLLEEAAIDGVPALVIDPKGDLSNLLLAFPSLDGPSFQPWVNEDEARRKGLDTPAFAAAEAEKWKKGLASWGQDAARIQRLRDSAEFVIYTPGSDAGVPVSILKSFAAPDPATANDREALRDRISAAATSLLGLAGIDADPVQSREHVLLSTIFDQAWKEGRDLDLAAVIAAVQNPPFAKVGVLDLDSFYPAKDRFGLAMALNNLLASPGFEAWLQGEPLDAGRMLWDPQGKPRISIFSIAHLNDSERMFFVSLLLNQTLSWMRSQSGTTSLRAILYMDEIFGYFPPVANPPSKKPLLTLLKQARAFGLGVVLATQNPVDLDYKGLANTGTWFIGRLQTDRDKQRVLEGLEGAVSSSGGKFDRAAMEQTLAGLGSRVFLMNNVHDDAPVCFESRWCLSYLRGPLARPQIRQLMAGRQSAPTAAPAPAAPSAAAPPAPAPAANAAPVLPPDIPQYYLPARTPGALAYQPRALASATVHFEEKKLAVDEIRSVLLAAPITDSAVAVDWSAAELLADLTVHDLEKEPAGECTWCDLPAAAAKPKNYAAWSKTFATYLYQSETLELHRSPSLGEVSRPGEDERDFRLRLTARAREERDALSEKLRAKYAPKLQTLQDRLLRARQKLELEKQQASSQTLDSVLSIGTSLLGAFLGGGRRSSSLSKVGTAARSMNRIGKERGDVGRAEESVESIEAQIQALEEQFQQELAEVSAKSDPATEPFETVLVKPRKTNIQVQLVALGWAPRSE
jgi:hypothetical protein